MIENLEHLCLKIKHNLTYVFKSIKINFLILEISKVNVIFKKKNEFNTAYLRGSLENPYIHQ